MLTMLINDKYHTFYFINIFYVRKISYICTKKINNNPKIYSYGKVII